MSMTTFFDYLKNYCCCCNANKEHGSDDDQVNIQTTLLCCVKTNSLHVDVRDKEDQQDMKISDLENKDGNKNEPEKNMSKLKSI